MTPADLESIVPADHELTDGEIDNVVYLCCKYGVGWGMRACDLAAVRALLLTRRGPLGLWSLLDITANYLWDHVCGEPDEFTAEQLRDILAEMITKWWSETSDAERGDTN